MPDDPGPDPHARVQALLLRAIDSFEKLELVLCLARASEALDVSALAAVANARTSVVEEALARLAVVGVVTEPSPGAWTMVAGGAWTDAVAELVALHAREPVTIMRMMTETALERLRDTSARAFADAFVLRKGKKGDDDA